MRHLIGAVLCLALASGIAGAADNGKQKRGAPGRPPAQEAARTPSGTTVQFSVEHVRVMRSHYASRHRGLPPGLQKKYARTGQLPPGWQKKIEPLPVAIERGMPRLPADHRRGVIDGHAVIYHATSGLIIDVAVLF